ncbi:MULTISPECIES: hypothetical protein [unclassified Blastococcus]
MTDPLVVGLLVLLALVGRRAEPRGHVDVPPGPTVDHRAAPRWLYPVLGAGVVGAVAVAALVAAQDPEQGVSIFGTVVLGAMAAWSAFGLYVTSTPAPPGKGWLVWAMRGAILTASAVLAVGLWRELDAGSRSDRVSIVVFGVGIVVAVVIDVVQARRNR